MEALNLPAPQGKPRIVVIGGGFGGLNFVHALDTRRYQVVLLDQYNYHTFAPLLYQVATAGLDAPDICGALRKSFRGKKDFHFRMLRVGGIDELLQQVHTEAGNIHYDHLVLATGTRANFFGNKNLEAHALPLKTVPHARQLRHHIFQALERADLTDDPAERASLLTFLIVGGGPSGVELAGALSELRSHVLERDYPDTNTDHIRFILVEGGDELLAQFSDKSSKDAHRNLEDMNIELWFGKLIADYDGRVATFKDGSTLATHTVIWGAGVTGEIIAGINDESVQKAHYLIDDHLRVKEYDNVYAIGDVAYLTSKEWPKGHPGVAQVAIQMGKRLAKNFNALAKGRGNRRIYLLRQGQSGHHRAQPRGGRPAGGDAPQRLPGLVYLGRGAHLLPDRFSQPPVHLPELGG